ncbi:molybdopterin-dependent oxidoreductase [[Clostridium] aminophilum]|uniref:molybdopterin-dependent oxidoreductase n=1 Tax=[Clostridium] aminophilum TaxID=1526 RepID=UPI002ED478EF
MHCQRCINVCHRIACNGAIRSGRLGNFHIVEAPFGENYKETGCESCGNCVSVCPTGAIVLKREKSYREWEVKKVRTTCPHCATGCQLDLVVKEGRIVNAESADGPANHRRLCVKGRNGSFDFVHAADRLKKPLIKDRSTGIFREATWEKAISYTAKRFLEIREKYGCESLAGFACSRSSNEDVYMVQKMVRTCFGTNTTDNCARVCHSASVAGLAKTLGSGAMTNPIYDITHDVEPIQKGSDCQFILADQFSQNSGGVGPVYRDLFLQLYSCHVLDLPFGVFVSEDDQADFLISSLDFGEGERPSAGRISRLRSHPQRIHRTIPRGPMYMSPSQRQSAR